MPKAGSNTSQQNSQDIAVLKSEFSTLTKTVDRIENNHLVHIAADIKSVSSELGEFRQFVTQQITNLSLTDAKREPAFNLGSEVIRGIIMAVIAGVMFLIIKR